MVNEIPPIIDAGNSHERVVVNLILFSPLEGISQDYFWKNYDKIKESISLDSEDFSEFVSSLSDGQKMRYIGSKSIAANPHYIMRLANRWLITLVKWEIFWNTDISFEDDFQKLIYSMEDEISKRLKIVEAEESPTRLLGRVLVHIKNPAGLGEDYQKKVDKAIDSITTLTKGVSTIWTESGIRKEGGYDWGQRMEKPDKSKSLFSQSVFLYGNNFEPYPLHIMEDIGISIILLYEVFRFINQAVSWFDDIDSELQISRRIFGPKRRILSKILRYSEIVNKEYKVESKYQATLYQQRVDILPHPILSSEDEKKYRNDLDTLKDEIRMIFKDVDVEHYTSEIAKDLWKWPDFHSLETKWRIQENDYEERMVKVEYFILVSLLVGFLFPLLLQDIFAGELVSAIANYLQILTFIVAIVILRIRK